MSRRERCNPRVWFPEEADRATYHSIFTRRGAVCQRTTVAQAENVRVGIVKGTNVGVHHADTIITTPFRARMRNGKTGRPRRRPKSCSQSLRTSPSIRSGSASPISTRNAVSTPRMSRDRSPGTAAGGCSRTRSRSARSPIAVSSRRYRCRSRATSICEPLCDRRPRAISGQSAQQRSLGSKFSRIDK